MQPDEAMPEHHSLVREVLYQEELAIIELGLPFPMSRFSWQLFLLDTGAGTGLVSLVLSTILNGTAIGDNLTVWATDLRTNGAILDRPQLTKYKHLPWIISQETLHSITRHILALTYGQRS